MVSPRVTFEEDPTRTLSSPPLEFAAWKEPSALMAVTTWLTVKPNIRLEAAIEMFRGGEITLERAAEIAGINRWLFKDVLIQRGIKIVVEVESKDELIKATREIRDRSR